MIKNKTMVNIKNHQEKGEDEDHLESLDASVKKKDSSNVLNLQGKKVKTNTPTNVKIVRRPTLS